MLRYLLPAAACCAWLAVGLFFAGCSDSGISREIPDFSQLSILLYSDSGTEGNFAQQALDDFGADYTLVEDPEELFAQAGNAFHLLVIDNPDAESEDLLDVVEEYVDNGGRLVISTWQSQFYPDHPLWAALGADIGQAPSDDVVPQFKWLEGHPVFTFPNRVPDLTALTDNFDFSFNYFPGNAQANGIAVGGITPEPAADSATMFVNVNGRTVLNSFLLLDAVEIVNEVVIPNDEDEDSEPDARELWQNEIVFVLQGEVNAVTLPGVFSTVRGGERNR